MSGFSDTDDFGEWQKLVDLRLSDFAIWWGLRPIMNIQLAEVLNHKSMAIFVDEKVAAIAANISSWRRRYGTAAYHAKIGYVRAARDVCCRTKHQQTLPLARDARNRDRREPILMAICGR